MAIAVSQCSSLRLPSSCSLLPTRSAQYGPSLGAHHHHLSFRRVGRSLDTFVAAAADFSSNQPPPEHIAGGSGGDGDGGHRGSGGGGDPNSFDDEEENHKKKNHKKEGMLMSQKVTLAYAALVGVGGVMGYMKSGSQKSLAAGGGSALLLYYVYTQLPLRPSFASSLGLGISAALLAVMGSRFKNSGKIFPAGVVSFISLIMVAGYAHGILRGFH